MNQNTTNDFELAKQLLGNEVEIMDPYEPRIPKSIIKGYDNLNIVLTREAITAACRASQNLCVIVFPRRNQAEHNILDEFLSQNPILKTTVITWSSRLVYIWMRITDWRPTNHELPEASWFSSGTIPFGLSLESCHGSRFLSVGGTTVVSVKFWSLNWNMQLHDTFLLEMIETSDGSLFLPGRRIRKKFGVYTAAKFFVMRLLMEHITETEGFTIYTSETGRIKISQEKLRAIIFTWLSRQAQLRNVPYPSGDPEGEIIRTIKQICVTKQAESKPEGSKA